MPHGQPVGFSYGLHGYATAFDSLNKSPHKHLTSDQPLPQFDDDQGIDERYDADSNDSCGEDNVPNDDFTSPKAPKPRPLDQTFVPVKGKKYFSVTIGYPAMRRALRARGWIEVKCYRRI